jgi:hypothetical protein
VADAVPNPVVADAEHQVVGGMRIDGEVEHEDLLVQAEILVPLPVRKSALDGGAAAVLRLRWALAQVPTGPVAGQVVLANTGKARKLTRSAALIPRVRRILHRHRCTILLAGKVRENARLRAGSTTLTAAGEGAWGSRPTSPTR